MSITCPLPNGAPRNPTLRPLADCTAAGRFGEEVSSPRYKAEQAWWRREHNNNNRTAIILTLSLSHTHTCTVADGKLYIMEGKRRDDILDWDGSCGLPELTYNDQHKQQLEESE